jgi:hypothetical protein
VVEIGSKLISEDVLETGILKSDEGARVFEYAMQCALPLNTYVFRDDGDSDSSNDLHYPGAGLLTTTAGWTTSSLSTGSQQDLLACLLAHLNPYTVPVSILLSGQDVNDDSALEPLQSAFSFDEALWVARFSITSTVPLLSVRSLQDLAPECEHKVFTDLQTRVCGEGIEDCGVAIRDDIATACWSPSPGHYTCDGVRAIRASNPNGFAVVRLDGAEIAETFFGEDGSVRHRVAQAAAAA